MHAPQFFTATVLNWQHLLTDDSIKQIIIDAIKHRVQTGEVRVYGLVIMPNHWHAIWELQPQVNKADFQRDLLKYISRRVIDKLKTEGRESQLSAYTVDAADRTIQIWERNSLSIDIYSYTVFNQKLNYIHNNPVAGKWRLAETAYDYRYSSIRFYETGVDELGIFSHYMQYH